MWKSPVGKGAIRVTDDYDEGVNLIIRGTDHMSNTGKQVILYRLLEEIGLVRECDISFLPSTRQAVVEAGWCLFVVIVA